MKSKWLQQINQIIINKYYTKITKTNFRCHRDNILKVLIHNLYQN